MSETTTCAGCGGTFATSVMDYTDAGLMCAPCAVAQTPLGEPGTSVLGLAGYGLLAAMFACSPPCLSSRSVQSTTMTVSGNPGASTTSTSMSLDPPGLIIALFALLIAVNGVRLAVGARGGLVWRGLAGLGFSGLALVAVLRGVMSLPMTLPF